MSRDTLENMSVQCKIIVLNKKAIDLSKTILQSYTKPFPGSLFSRVSSTTESLKQAMHELQ